MAAVRFNCPKCGQVLEADLSLAGQSVQCPKCQHIFPSPTATSAMLLPPPPPNVETLPSAIWSLVLGILSLSCFWILSAIPAVICGHHARAKIKASGGTAGGAGLALAGLILGYIAIAMTVIFLPLYIGFVTNLRAGAAPSFFRASSRSDSRRSACVNNLRLIDHAKQQLATASQTMSDSYVPTMAELQPYFKGGGAPVCRDGGVYTINAITSNPTCSLSGPPFKHELVNDIY